LNYYNELIEIFFETFNVPSLCLQPVGWLSMYATGRTTGCILDIGETCTQLCSIVGGYGLQKTWQFLGGRLQTEYLAKRIAEKVPGFGCNMCDLLLTQKIKETYGFVALVSLLLYCTYDSRIMKKSPKIQASQSWFK
jgi:actin-related protein